MTLLEEKILKELERRLRLPETDIRRGVTITMKEDGNRITVIPCFEYADGSRMPKGCGLMDAEYVILAGNGPARTAAMGGEPKDALSQLANYAEILKDWKTDLRRVDDYRKKHMHLPIPGDAFDWYSDLFKSTCGRRPKGWESPYEETFVY